MRSKKHVHYLRGLAYINDETDICEISERGVANVYLK